MNAQVIEVAKRIADIALDDYAKTFLKVVSYDYERIYMEGFNKDDENFYKVMISTKAIDETKLKYIVYEEYEDVFGGGLNKVYEGEIKYNTLGI